MPNIEPLSATHPQLACGWHPLKNGNLTPDDVTAKSHWKVWWTCDRNPRHEWQQVVYRRLFRDCPLCKHEARSLAKLFPEVAAEWHPTLNGDLLPADVAAGSWKKVWWQCPKDASHAYDASLSNRTGRRSGCPFCTGRKVNQSNSLAALRPDLAREWHPRLNEELRPEDVTCGSDQKFGGFARANMNGWRASTSECD